MALTEMCRKCGSVLSLVLTLVVVALSWSCTRSSDSKGRIRLTVPAKISSLRQQGKVAGQSVATAQLEYAAVNIRHGMTGFPFVHEMEFHDNGPTGTEIVIEVPNPPTGSDLFVQFMGAYQDDESMLISYGDSGGLIAISAGSVTELNLNATVFGSATKEGLVAGRVLTGQSPDVGPTGEMIMRFNPPAGKPQMNLDVTEIWNGWFQIFALDSTSISFDYAMPDGTTVFSNVSLSSPIFSSPTGLNHRVKFEVPQSTRLDGDGSSASTRTQLPKDLVLGYFASPALASPNWTGYNMCYSTLDESLMGMWANETMTIPLVYNANGSAAEIRQVAGGVASTFQNAFTSASCDPASGTAMRLYPQSIGYNEGDVIGMRGPFQRLDPVTRWEGYVRSKFDSGLSQIVLNWKYLPGAGSVVGGATIFGKYSPYGGGDGGGGHGEPCDSYAQQRGFSPVLEIAGGGETASIGSVDGHPVTSSDAYSFRFVICPFRQQGTMRRYSQHGVTASCVGNCGDSMHFGWAVPGDNLDVSGAAEFRSDGSGISKAAYSKVTQVVSNSNPLYTEIDVYDSTGFVAGAEVLLMVTGSANSGCPSNYNGQPIGAGMHAFTRLLSGSSNPLKIPKGTFMDEFPTGANAALNAVGALAEPADSFCYVQIVQIPHFYDMNLTGAPNIYTISPMSLGDSIGGGVVAMRFNGTVTVGALSSIHLDGKGYAGGTGAANFGAGIGGHYSSAGGSVNGGEASVGGGGGGYGNGANGAASNGKGSSNFGGSGPMGVFAGGGGAYYGGFSGGAGGGVLMLNMRNLVLNANLSVRANGANGLSSAAGGGGGSVNLVAKSVVQNAGSLIELQAIGGNGGSVGGGGYMRLAGCESNVAPASLVNPTSTNTKGTTGSTSGAGDGNTEVLAGFGMSGYDTHFCYEH